MRAFILSLIALAAITAISAAALRFVPMSASDVYSEKPNVRLCAVWEGVRPLAVALGLFRGGKREAVGWVERSADPTS